MKKIGIVGTGEHMTNVLLPAIRAIPGASVIGVVSAGRRRAEATAQAWGVPESFDDATAMLMQHADLDLVVVAATPLVHAEVARESARVGIDCFVEKPPAPNLQQLRQLCRDLENDAPRSVVNVGYNFRFCDAILNLKEQQSRLGAVCVAKMSISARKPTASIWGMGSLVESFLYAVAIHGIELLIAEFGRLELLSASHSKVGLERFHLSCTFRSVSGVTCELSCDNVSNRFRFGYELLGEWGRIRNDNLERTSWEYVSEPDSAPALPKMFHGVETSGLLGGFERNGYGRLLRKVLEGGASGAPSELSGSVAVYEAIESIVAALSMSRGYVGG